MLVPELDVATLGLSLEFYVGVLGFTVGYERHDEQFVYLECGDVAVMLQQEGGLGRRFTTAPLHAPFGRGINFEFQVADVDAVLARALAAGTPIVIPIEERWYRTGAGSGNDGRYHADRIETGNRQFVVSDPDGYLWRPYSDLGFRRAEA